MIMTYTSRSSQESVLQPQSDPYIKSETSIKIPLFTAKAAPKVLMSVREPFKKKCGIFHTWSDPTPLATPYGKKCGKFSRFFFQAGYPPKNMV